MVVNGDWIKAVRFPHVIEFGGSCAAGGLMKHFLGNPPD